VATTASGQGWLKLTQRPSAHVSAFLHVNSPAKHLELMHHPSIHLSMCPHDNSPAKHLLLRRSAPLAGRWPFLCQSTAAAAAADPQVPAPVASTPATDHTWMDRQADRQTQTYRQAGRQMDGRTDSKAGRQAGRQTDLQSVQGPGCIRDAVKVHKAEAARRAGELVQHQAHFQHRGHAAKRHLQVPFAADRYTTGSSKQRCWPTCSRPQPTRLKSIGHGLSYLTCRIGIFDPIW
jgi:hypothetical protein